MAVYICYAILVMASLLYVLTGDGWLITVGCLPGVCVFIYYLNRAIKQIIEDHLG